MLNEDAIDLFNRVPWVPPSWCSERPAQVNEIRAQLRLRPFFMP